MQYLAGVRLAARISSAPLIRRTQFVRAYAAISNSKPPVRQSIRGHESLYTTGRMLTLCRNNQPEQRR